MRTYEEEKDGRVAGLVVPIEDQKLKSGLIRKSRFTTHRNDVYPTNLKSFIIKIMENPETQELLMENAEEQMVFELESLGATIKKEPNEKGAYVATFSFETAITTIRFILNDEQTGAELVITNMTTLPNEEQGKGWGSYAVKNILRWAKANKLTKILVDQVQSDSEVFWNKNGFIKASEPNPTNLFVYQE